MSSPVTDNVKTARTLRATLSLGLGVAGLIHLLPLPGVLGADMLQRLYGIDLLDADLALLLRHRAVLFGLLGLLLLSAVRQHALRTAAIVGGIISTASFLLLALGGDDIGAGLMPVVVGDVVALVCLIGAAVAHGALRRRPDDVAQHMRQGR